MTKMLLFNIIFSILILNWY